MNHKNSIILKSILNKYTVALYIIVTIVAMLYSPTDTGIRNPLGMGELGDYIAHFIIYLPWMICGEIIWGDRLNDKLWFTIGTLFVVSLEICQYFLPYRGFNIYDMLVGEVGLLVSCALLRTWRRLSL